MEEPPTHPLPTLIAQLQKEEKEINLTNLSLLPFKKKILIQIKRNQMLVSFSFLLD